MVESTVKETEHRGDEEDGHHSVVDPSGGCVGRTLVRVCVGEKVQVMCGEKVDEE